MFAQKSGVFNSSFQSLDTYCLIFLVSPPLVGLIAATAPSGIGWPLLGVIFNYVRCALALSS
jgi:hypothetical protein